MIDLLFPIDDSRIYDIKKLRFLRANLSRARNRGKKTWEVDVSEYELYEIGDNQNWKCAITGDDLQFVRGGTKWRNYWCNPYSCSIDRIDPTRGYYVDNVQLLTHRANIWKSNFTNEELELLSKQFLANYANKIKEK